MSGACMSCKRGVMGGWREGGELRTDDGEEEGEGEESEETAKGGGGAESESRGGGGVGSAVVFAHKQLTVAMAL